MKYKYYVFYWNTKVYFQYLKDAKKYRDSLPYYQQEDAEIIKLKKGEKWDL